jgi:myo-inositol 2-dehydrogenase/D-chiro-inositol 1-dehydrogenase
MRFAVVGDALSVLPFLRVVASRPEHEIASLALAPGLHAALQSSAPTARLCRGWEELLVDRRLDAVVVAGDDDGALTAARQLAAAAMPLIVDASVGRSATFAYELTLLQADQPVKLVPLFTSRAHPAVAKLRDMLAAGSLGGVRHVQIERKLATGESDFPTTDLSSADIATIFLPDVDLLRSIWGEYDQVTAVRSGESGSRFSLLTITLGGKGVPQAVWSAAVSDRGPAWRLNVVCDRGAVSLSGDSDAGALTLDASGAGSVERRETFPFDGARWLLERLDVDSTNRGLAARARSAEAIMLPNWADFTRAVELYDAIERSVRRRRTIDIHFETPSERSQFKTQMTAIGCSVLPLTLLAYTAYLFAETFFALGPWVKQALWLLTFLPLGAFLAMQALYFLTRPSAEHRDRRAAGDAKQG